MGLCPECGWHRGTRGKSTCRRSRPIGKVLEYGQIPHGKKEAILIEDKDGDVWRRIVFPNGQTHGWAMETLHKEQS